MHRTSSGPPGRTLVAWLLALTLLGGCATQPMPRPDSGAGVGRAVAQPLRDLSLIRETAPEVLRRAAVAPYHLTRAQYCPSLRVELNALESALGPDLAPGGRTQGVSIGGLAVDLIAGAVGLPFRGAVRWVSRAI